MAKNSQNTQVVCVMCFSVKRFCFQDFDHANCSHIRELGVKRFSGVSGHTRHMGWNQAHTKACVYAGLVDKPNLPT